jgi:hypothetical protein
MTEDSHEHARVFRALSMNLISTFSFHPPLAKRFAVLFPAIMRVLSSLEGVQELSDAIDCICELADAVNYDPAQLYSDETLPENAAKKTTLVDGLLTSLICLEHRGSPGDDGEDPMSPDPEYGPATQKLMGVTKRFLSRVPSAAIDRSLLLQTSFCNQATLHRLCVMYLYGDDEATVPSPPSTTANAANSSDDATSSGTDNDKTSSSSQSYKAKRLRLKVSAQELVTSWLSAHSPLEGPLPISPEWVAFSPPRSSSGDDSGGAGIDTLTLLYLGFVTIMASKLPEVVRDGSLLFFQVPVPSHPELLPR